MALMRVGYQPFPVSIRNSATALANMLMQMTAAHLFVSGGESIHNVIKAANVEMLSKGKGVEILAVSISHDLFPFDTTEPEFLPPVTPPDLNHPALILHSSGRLRLSR